MKKALAWILALLVLVAAGGCAYVYRTIRTLEVETLSESLHVISGLGGNVGVLKTSAGAVVVDTMMFRTQGERVRETVEEVAGAPIAIINTHYHRDHTHGNPAFAPGTQVISTRRTLDHLHERDADYWEGDAASLLPSRTFETEELLEIGGKKIRCKHLGRGHTDGDLVVLFEDERVLHTGDLLFHDRFPNIDLEAGGSIREWIGTIDRILELDFDRVIPGHGAVTDKDGLRRYQAFLRELWDVGMAAARDGTTLEETVRTAHLKTAETMEPMIVPFVVRLDHDFVIKRAWQEATGAIPYTPPAPAVR